MIFAMEVKVKRNAHFRAFFMFIKKIDHPLKVNTYTNRQIYY